MVYSPQPDMGSGRKDPALLKFPHYFMIARIDAIFLAWSRVFDEVDHQLLLQ